MRRDPPRDATRRRLLLLAASGMLASCGGSGTVPRAASLSTPPAHAPAAASAPGAIAKSSKRGIAYDLASAQDVDALAPGVSWWGGGSLQPNAGAPTDTALWDQMDFVPMLRNADYDANRVAAFLAARPSIKYLLVLDEPNTVAQAHLTPAQAAAAWPGYEAIAARAGVKIVGPAMARGTMPGYADPVTWLDDFHAAYRAAHRNRDPRIDYLALHWDDDGLAAQLDRLAKFGKPFWVTARARAPARADGTQVDTPARQAARMTAVVNTCETRADVFRYAWSTGRKSDDPHATSLFGATPGELTELGRLYLTLPYSG